MPPYAEDGMPQTAQSGNPPAGSTTAWRAFALAVPIAAFAGLAVLLAGALGRDPGALPSSMIGRLVPTFSLPPIEGRTKGLSSADLIGSASLVNVFASWCVACRDEHPAVHGVESGWPVPVHGINYNDRPANAAAWLDALGDPYDRTGADRDVQIAIDWGVYGVPETFVVSTDGTILYRHVGPVTALVLGDVMLPLIEEASR